MADSAPGVPYTPTITITDANGTPVTSGVTGTMSLYSPSSTVAVGSAAVTHQGDGAWGTTFAGSLLTGLGTYRFLVPSLVTPGGTLVNQGGTFQVGLTAWWTLRDLLTSVRLALRDGWTGTTSALGTTTTFIDAARAYGADAGWVGSEAVFFGTGASMQQEYTISNFVAASGTFTFTPAAGSAIAAGTPYLLGNRNGQGFAHDEVLDAIRTAIRRTRSLRRVTDQVSVTSAVLVYEYAVPSGWVSVDRVYYQPDAGQATRWQVLSPAYWSYRADRGLLTLDMPPPNNALRLEGRALPTEPASFGAAVEVDGATVRDDVLYELLLASDKPSDRQRAAALAGGVQRARLGAQLVRL